ncbi:PAX-interacting protein 1 [Hordeum vulgare]|nr:PAX-interacting protein 1 [Hordeum vulgare]
MLEEKVARTMLDDVRGVACIDGGAGDSPTTDGAGATNVVADLVEEVAGSNSVSSDTVCAGAHAGDEQVVKEEDDLVGNKRKVAMTAFKDEYDPTFVDNDVYKYTSRDGVDDGNVDSFVSKEVQKIKAKGKAAYYKRKKYCPYSTTKLKTKDGIFENLLSHARDASRSGEMPRLGCNMQP